MPIEWPGGVSSTMNVKVEDNTLNPINILEADSPFNIKITWKVPPGFAGLIAGSFRLRAYAESLGPGDEKKLGSDVNVAVVPNQEDYEGTIPVAASVLEGEGATPQRSGVYKIVAVLQLKNGAVFTDVSGFAEAPLTLFRLP